MIEQPGTPTPTGPRRLTRSSDRMLGGVCAGLADYLGVDVTVVRVLSLLGAVFGLGSIVVVYVVAWVLVPEAPASHWAGAPVDTTEAR